MKSILAYFLLLSVLSLRAQAELPRELDPAALTHDELLTLFDGADPANWPPERVFEEHYVKSYYAEWQKESKQSVQLRRIIGRNPKVYGELSAKILTEGTDPRLFGTAAEFVNLQPDKERSRRAILTFLSRSDVEPTEIHVNVAASTLARVGRSEDAVALRLYLDRRDLTKRQDLWMRLVKFAGNEFIDLIEADIAALEAMRDRGDSAFSAETLNSKAGFLRVLKRNFDERLAAKRREGPGVENAYLLENKQISPSIAPLGSVDPKEIKKEFVAINANQKISSKWPYIVVGIALLFILVIVLRAAKRKGNSRKTKSPSHREGK